MRQPAPFVDADFQDLKAFPLRWRWTEERYHVLPPEALAAIRPFTPQRAREMWDWCYAFHDLAKAPAEVTLSSAVFTAIHRLDTSPLDEAPARRWLVARGVHGDPDVIVSWQPDCAVLTRWSVFCRYWDDFCYPGSDDLVVWPFNEEWALLYWHVEELIFGVKVTKAEEAPSAA